MKKKLLTAIACLALTTGISFAKSLVLTLSDGSHVYYLLGKEANPLMKFVDGKITVNTDVYEISGIKNFYISETDDPNSIESTIAKSNISYKANTFIAKVANVKAVKVFSVNGAEVSANVSQTGEMVSVDLNGLATGTYLIKVGKSTFKVIKK